MALEIEINGSVDADSRYVTFATAPCRIRLDRMGSDTQVTLRSKAVQAGGGQVVFYATPTAQSRATFKLTVPGNGDWVSFWIGGKWGQPSIDDGDCLLIASGTEALEVPLMIRVRKNANALLPRERDRFLEAWKVLNNAGAGKFQDFRDMHIDAANGEEHRGPQFLPWHRAYLLDLERELQAVDPAVALHYWRFDEPAPRIFRSNFMGATSQGSFGATASKVVFDPGHPLSGWATDGNLGILRTAFFDTQMSAASGVPGFPVISQAETLDLGNRYAQFIAMEGTPHGAAHVSFAGYLSEIGTAPKDPLFFMLHSNVDRLWALWQWINKHTNPDDPDVYQGQNRDGRRLDDTIWPWNDVVTPPRPDFAPRGTTGLADSPTTAAPGSRPTIRSLIDFQGHQAISAHIGCGYDNVPFEFV